MSNRKAIYVPAVNEPSFWGPEGQGVIAWLLWHKNNPDTYPGVVPPVHLEVPLEIVKGYFDQLSYDLVGFNPVGGPGVLIEGTRTISLAWVMWTARRLDISPEEAHLIGIQRRDLEGMTVGKADQFGEWAKGFADDFKPRAYITTVSKPKRQSKFRLNLTNDGKNIVVFSDSLTISRAATISVILDETVAVFSNADEFGQTDLLRLMRTLEMSSKPFQLVAWI